MQTILIIEDNDEIRENTSEMLELGHYLVVTAKEGKSGYEMAKSCGPDLILCDLMMPETDGRAFFRLAKADNTLNKIPIIFFSAGSAQHLQKEITRIADGFLKKPFTEHELFSTIKSLLKDTPD